MENMEIMQLDELASEQAGEMEGKYLTFWTDGQVFAVPIADVVQIVGMQKITEVPEYPAYAKGIINLRGTVIPVIDIRLRFGKEQADYTDRTCMIVTNIRGNYFGFVVDEVDEVTEINDASISLPPGIDGDGSNEYLIGIARLEEKIVLIIDTTKLLNDQAFFTLTQKVF